MEYHFYINLQSRPDKRANVEKQLKSIGIEHPNRFDAIHDTFGPLGATKSHCEVVKMARARGWPHVCVFEDDVMFLDPSWLQKQLAETMDRLTKWDVLLLGGNNYPPYERIDKHLVKVTNLQVSIAYIVHADHYDTFISHLEEGIQLLQQTRRSELYIIDMWWKILQKQFNYYLITPLTVTQDGGYSNNANQYVNRQVYDNCMLDLK